MKTENYDFSFIDLFAGIGGFHHAFRQLGGTCKFTSEIDKYCQQSYLSNFETELMAGDITKVDAESIPDHSILAGGFPCQPFSLAGVSKYNSLGYDHGFKHETKGTLFFDIARILDAKRPDAFILENVKNLVSHDKGNTFKTILSVLRDELEYVVHTAVIDAGAFLPQHRERIFIVGFSEDIEFHFPPIQEKNRPSLYELMEPEVDPKYTLSDKLWSYLQAYAEKHRRLGNGFGFGLIDPSDLNVTTRTLSARYNKDGSEILLNQGPDLNPRRLTPRECARIMGFPDSHLIPVSDTQAYKQFGNAVAVPVARYVASAVLEALERHNKLQVSTQQS